MEANTLGLIRDSMTVPNGPAVHLLEALFGLPLYMNALAPTTTLPLSESQVPRAAVPTAIVRSGMPAETTRDSRSAFRSVLD